MRNRHDGESRRQTATPPTLEKRTSSRLHTGYASECLMGGLPSEPNRLDSLGVCASWFAGTLHLMAHRGGIDGDRTVCGQLT